MKHKHLITFGPVMSAAWIPGRFLFIYSWPHIVLNHFENAILDQGSGESPIPVKGLSTEPLASQSASGSNLLTVGVKCDTLLTAGRLDLGKGPQVRHVPDMADRLQSCKADTAHTAEPVIKSNTMSRRSTYLVIFNGAICAFFFIYVFFFSQATRTVRSDVVQGVLIGFGLAFVTAQVYARIKATKVNGWITMFGLGMPGNSMLLRAAHAQLFPGPVNVPQEAMYWWTNTDGAGHALSGVHDYVMHFPAGQLPPNNAFWSLTMGDAKNRFVANPIKRYSVSDRSGLAQNADGSVDIYLQNTAPAGHESNWLPAPEGNFILWLRVYIPGQAILDGEYELPPVIKVR